MDSGELEREKGITILAKNTAVTRSTPDGPVPDPKASSKDKVLLKGQGEKGWQGEGQGQEIQILVVEVVEDHR